MAKKEELKKLEKSLDILKLGIEILQKGIGFYVYYNKPTKGKRNFTIHKSSCGRCAWGTGRMAKAVPGRNGVWIGPFRNTNQATQFINENFNPPPSQINICDSCSN